MAHVQEITIAYRTDDKWQYIHFPAGSVSIERSAKINRATGENEAEARVTVTSREQWVLHSHPIEEVVEDGSVIRSEVVT
jgi:hypothetical protein